MSIFIDGPASAIAEMSPATMAKAIVDWRLGPRTKSSGLSLRTYELCHFTREKLKILPPGAAVAIAEGVGWGLTNGLFCPAPDDAQGNGYLVLTRLARKLFESGKLGEWRPLAGLQRDDLHPDIADACWDSLCSGKLDVAVFEAFRALEEAARNAISDYSGKSGSDVFSVAFNKDKGPLRDRSCDDPGEREAWRSLFVGAYGAFRNPPAHRSGTKTGATAVREELMLASLLMRRIVEARSQPRE